LFSFYFPPADGTAMPSSAREFTAWFATQARGSSLLGPAAWVVQTYLQMKRLGLPCELVSKWPGRGIVLAHRDHLPEAWPMQADLYVVCCLADRTLPHASANLHVLQNPFQRVRLGAHVYVPHWPQPGLQARQPERGAQATNLAFFGEADNLAPELRTPEFTAWCTSQGLNFRIPPRDHWADYRDVDVAIAVRRFSASWTAPEKPATKLFNAWLGGVVPVVGKEAAYAHHGQHGQDCLIVSDGPAMKALLLRLHQDRAFLLQLQAGGASRALGFSHEATARHWAELLTTGVLPAAERRKKRSTLAMVPSKLMARLKSGLAWRGHLLSNLSPSAPAGTT